MNIGNVPKWNVNFRLLISQKVQKFSNPKSNSAPSLESSNKSVWYEIAPGASPNNLLVFVSHLFFLLSLFLLAARVGQKIQNDQIYFLIASRWGVINDCSDESKTYFGNFPPLWISPFDLTLLTLCVCVCVAYVCQQVCFCGVQLCVCVCVCVGGPILNLFDGWKVHLSHGGQ